MAFDKAFYLVTRDIAIRSGLAHTRYRTSDGRFILDNKDLSRLRLTADEYISGLRGVEKISEEDATAIIARGGYILGINSDDVVEQPQPTNNDVAGDDAEIEQNVENNEQENEEE